MNHPALVWCWFALLLGLAVCVAIGGWLAMEDDDKNGGDL